MKPGPAAALILAALGTCACARLMPVSSGAVDARPIVGVEGKARVLSDASVPAVAR